MSTSTTPNRRNGASGRLAAPKAKAIIDVKPELIRRRAYEIFLTRNGRPGDHLSDWIQAEQELNSASRVAPIAVRARERRGGSPRAGLNSQPIRDGILDNRDGSTLALHS